MTIWFNYHLEARVVEVLNAVPTSDAPHAFGRPYLTAYQLAIQVDQLYPDVARDQGWDVGGIGVGRHNSLAQYLARELSRRISSDATYPVEGAFLSNMGVVGLVFADSGGSEVTSSLTGTGFDLSLFRLRRPDST